MITTTTQAGTRPSATMKTSTALTISLSASGSRNFPSMLTSPAAARQIAVEEVARRGDQVEQAGDERAQRVEVVDEEQHERDQHHPAHGHQVGEVRELAAEVATATAAHPCGVSSSTTPSPWHATWNGDASASVAARDRRAVRDQAPDPADQARAPTAASGGPRSP